MIISYSQLQLYNLCPYRYYCQYFLGWEVPQTEALKVGKSFHSNIFTPEQEENETSQRMLHALWNNDYFRKLAPHIEETEIKKVEEVEGYNIMAYFDGITKDSVIEFKTASKEWTEDDFEETVQPTLYLKLDGGKKNFIMVIVTKHKKPRIQIKEMGYEKEKWKEVKRNIKDMLQDFSFFQRSGQYCYFCPYQKYCEVWF